MFDSTLSFASVPRLTCFDLDACGIPPIWPISVRRFRQDDSAEFDAFLSYLSPEDLRLRFGRALRPEHPLVRKCLFGPPDGKGQILAAFGRAGDLVGSGCLVDGGNGRGEVAVIVRADARSRSVGRTLLSALAGCARNDGMALLRACVGAENTAALRLMKGAGFHAVGPCGQQRWFELSI